ncbi:TIGR04076 family protein [Eubacteriaceae bacterium ES2]|nr:TIGR04076 family protein [Eubacteriaceae bacterium ES2]
MEQKIKLTVKSSGCPFYTAGDKVIFDGPLLDKEKSGNFCMMALNALFPFIYAARKGVVTEQLLQCPDCDEKVTFVLQKAE